MSNHIFETKTYGTGVDFDANRLSDSELNELDQLGFNLDNIDRDARYTLFDYTPYQDLAEGRPSVQSMRETWHRHVMNIPTSVGEHLSECGYKQLIDCYFIDNHSHEIPILDVFSCYATPSPRETRIASTLFEWMGTNAGLFFLRETEDLKEKLKEMNYRASDIYTMSWALGNARSYLGEGTQAIDRLITVFEEASQTSSPRDIRIVDDLIRWCGTENGQTLLKTGLKL